MMIGERTHPSIQVPPWPSSPPPDTTTTNHSPFYPTTNSIDSPAASSPSSYLLNDAALAALSRFLPSADLHSDADSLSDPDSAAAIDAYSCDEFRMYEFKVRRCARGRSHDWTECPYAHPGEKARRRDPRRYHYSGAACPDFRKGSCKRGDACEFAHGVFECWLHPARYRTQPCKDGVACRRRVCFFAHTPEQLRVLPGSVAGMAAAAQQQQSPRGCGGGSTPGGGGCMAFDSYDGSPMRQHHHLNPTSLEAYFPKTMLPTSSPTSTLMSPPISPPSDSPPLSPSSGPQSLVRRGSSSMTEMLGSLRQLQLNSSSPWMQMAGSPPMAVVRRCPPPPFSSVPSTPTGPVCGTQVILRKPGGGGLFDGWDDPSSSPMAVVESGRDLRAKLAEKLSKENSLGRPVDGSAAGAGPDVGWVSDLVN